MENAEFEYFYVGDNSQRIGPMSATEFLAATAAGVVRGTTSVWRTGELNWREFRLVRTVWFGDALKRETRISPEFSIGSIFSTSWKIFAEGSNFGALVLAGVLYFLTAFISSFIPVAGSILPVLAWVVFLIVFPLLVTRSWDRGMKIELGDVFAFRQTFHTLLHFFLSYLIFTAISIVAILALVFPWFIVQGVYNYENESFISQECLPPSVPAELILPQDDIPPTADDGAENLSAAAESQETVLVDSASGQPCLYDDLKMFTESMFPACLLSLLVYLLLFTYFSLRFGWAFYAIADSNLSPIAAFRYSWKITKGRVWKLLGYSFLFSLLFVLGTIFTLGIGLLVISPFACLLCSVMYLKLSRSSSEPIPQGDILDF